MKDHSTEQVSQETSTHPHPLQKPIMLVAYAVMFAGILIAGSIVATTIFPSPFAQKSLLNGGIQDKNAGKGKNINGNVQGDAESELGDAQGMLSLGDDPVLGDREKAKVAIVEFSDYECPFCKKFHNEARKEIVKNYVDTGKAVLVFKDFPLSFHEPAASKEAVAANCVQKLAGDTAYFTYSESLFANTGTNGRGMPDDKLRALAKNAGATDDAFNECVQNNDFKDEIAADMSEGETFGISGTPAFIVGTLTKDGKIENTDKIVGAQPFSNFKKILDEKLK